MCAFPNFEMLVRLNIFYEKTADLRTVTMFVLKYSPAISIANWHSASLGSKAN